jgi:uncharacterized protein (TIGR00255 family)
MKSMTGFGRGAAATADGLTGFAVEISSVNRKQLEIRINLPRELSMLEPAVRSAVNARISRGSLAVRVALEGESTALGVPKVNRAALTGLIEQFRRVQEATGIPGQIEIQHLALVPGVIEDVALDASQPWIEEVLLRAVEAAVDNLLAMRSAEGKSIEADFARRLELLESLVDRIEPVAAGLPAFMREKMREKLKNAGLEVEYDDERLLKELVIYSDKSDVTEELTRLRSHFGQFRNFIRAEQEQAGRSLDFLVQEIFREITTLGNKACCCEVTPLVVEFKSELEKIREQVQNIE